ILVARSISEAESCGSISIDLIASCLWISIDLLVRGMKRKITKLDEVADFRFSLSNETDRGAALVCAAFLEEDLKALLERYFTDVPKVVSRLLDQSGPLATFSAKIDLSFVSGLISEEMYRALHLLRRIRNSFAHY